MFKMINNLPKMQLSDKVKNIPEALSIYINQIVYDQKRRGVDITTLSLGEAFFDIPLFDFKKLDLAKGYHYSESQGILELRQKIANYYEKYYNASVDYKNEIIISAGSKPIIFMAMQAVLNYGDEALIHEPAWLSYQEQLRLAGAEPKFIPYNSNIEDFHKYFTPKTKMLIINNPNNPAGWMYSKEDLISLYNQCRPRGIYILVDEAYSDFVVDKQFCSLANIIPNKDGIIVINSLSKNLGMSGWRVGYAISSPDVIEYILKVNQHLITCASSVLLYYLAKYFDRIISITLPQVTEVVEKRKRIANFMNNLGLKPLNGHSTFYFFVSIENFPETSLNFALYLLFKHGIAVVPGLAYGSSTERFIRISIGTESEERIHDALSTIKDLINAKDFDVDFVNRKLNEFGYRPFFR
ncbi:MAG: hypothetical protein A2287_00030 [Candidatus Melainabacteria bacterium RIFOXYA12_FULL_32_12]|nr:MAG: hypothetical protein A2255_10780 [Candidatus Melainabacteria bacterium RIFOXYA2_FULL_32_9]OGI31801.1 MAG: hypothetical protein A2287_00030 [Candidatus Melainabacteria bacterium RIFOXYA12_FULL_32_12]